MNTLNYEAVFCAALTGLLANPENQGPITEASIAKAITETILAAHDPPDAAGIAKGADWPATYRISIPGEEYDLLISERDALQARVNELVAKVAELERENADLFHAANSHG